MKILIADDEMLVRAGLKSSINWEKENIVIVGEADNGEKTLNMVAELKPDILLLDINMPIMDGIEVLKELKKRKEECKVIVLSCHDEFEYVKDAMRYGALDYILKHKIEPESIIDILKEVKQTIEAERKENDTEYIGIRPAKELIYEKNEFLCKLLKGYQFKDYELTRYLNTLGLKLSNKNIICILFEVDNYKEVLNRYNSYEKELLQVSIENISKELLSNVNGSEFVIKDDNLYAVLLSNIQETSEQNIFQNTITLIKRFQNTFKKYLNVELTFAASEMYNDLNNTGIAFEKALLSLTQKFLFPDNYYFFVNNIDFRTPFCVNSLVSSDEILGENISFEGALDYLISALEGLKPNKYVDIKSLKTFLSRIIYSLTSKFLEDESSFVNEDLWENINDVIGYLKKLKERSGSLLASSTELSNYLVRETVAYINKNYEKDISLKLLSDYLNVSEGYISRLFNKEMNMTVSNYINIKRVEKAKELLRKTTLKNYEIAERIGYKNHMHYNIVFKKLTNCTPSEYRNKLL
ncbi:response regulator transcription factor [Ruminiclostridium papyrosolvens]|uniref:Stage 0 sporulation protein A homolog n=1 Tax=Ruminiclostridium papyrosolvens C7 TaxID=1330534 RepID=U4R6B5_9FIRM|nr:response regulator [Ruminiclostridium papyrosolvens]EPR14033.1 chemotaxis protein CheY [Ruminiclostridium papyrosolvens C7]